MSQLETLLQADFVALDDEALMMAEGGRRNDNWTDVFYYASMIAEMWGGYVHARYK